MVRVRVTKQHTAAVAGAAVGAGAAEGKRKEAQA